MTTPFVTKLDLTLAHRLRSDLIEQGFQLSTPAHTLFAARKEGISCTLYKSGKLVVQGKQIREFLEFYLEPQILGTLEFTHPSIDLTPRIGCDEAGKGDFFGSLCIAGVYADGQQIEALRQLGVADSKTLSDAQIHRMAARIRSTCTYQIMILRPDKYNEMYARFNNLNHLLAWAHATIIATLSTKTGCQFAIVDQFARNGVLDQAIEQKKLVIELSQRIGGEADLVVASASILARDAFVSNLEELGKPYEMELPKGAGPPVIAALKRFAARYGREALVHVAKLHFKTLLHLEP